MTSRTSILVRAVAIPAVVFLTVVAAFAQSYKIETGQTPVPQGLAPTVRDALSPEALRVSGADGVLCEIWLRKSIPTQSTPAAGEGISYPEIPEGTLVGAIQVDRAVSDFRQQPLKEGVYTLRYAVQPDDANHQDVSAYRDFLLALPASMDDSLDAPEDKALYATSRKASGTRHPSVWMLYPAKGAPPALPGISHQPKDDVWVVYLKAPLAGADGKITPATIGLVVVGHAPPV
jgi:hypothetical protein